MIQDRLVELRDLTRRLQSDIEAGEAEKTRLRQEVERAKSELAEFKKVKPSVPKHLHADCLTCLWRLQAMKAMDGEK